MGVVNEQAESAKKLLVIERLTVGSSTISMPNAADLALWSAHDRCRGDTPRFVRRGIRLPGHRDVQAGVVLAVTDVRMVFTILAFFGAAALLVRGLGRVVADSASELDEESDAEAGDPAVGAGARVHARTRAATLDTSGPTFAAFLLGVVVIVGGLIYFPMLILGPIGERLVG
jgi:Na+-transporting methylmalonyl-CoA/oxaloacetate decarboxylase gamma subunit